MTSYYFISYIVEIEGKKSFENNLMEISGQKSVKDVQEELKKLYQNCNKIVIISWHEILKNQFKSQKIFGD